MPSNFLDSFYDNRKLSPRKMKPQKFTAPPKEFKVKNAKKTKIL